MAGIPQTLPVPPLVNEMTMLNAIRLAAEGGSPGGSTAWGDITGKPATIDTLAAGFGALFPIGGILQWSGTDYQIFNSVMDPLLGGTGVANIGTITNASNTTITGGGTLGLGGFTLTVPATGTAALLGIANTFTVAGAASTPAMSLTGALFTGGSATTTKPLCLIEPSGTTSTGWDTAGTGFGINLPTAFAGRALSVQKQGVEVASIKHDGIVRAAGFESGTFYSSGGTLFATASGASLMVADSIQTGAAFWWFHGTASPEGVFGIAPGSFYTSNIAGAGSLWIKATGSGTTGWEPLISGTIVTAVSALDTTQHVLATINGVSVKLCVAT